VPLAPGMKPPWKPGQSGNPSGLPGRPKGIIDAKTVLTGTILTDLQEMWSALTVKEKVDWARKNMGQFMAILFERASPTPTR
jgi:hypothetical protein